MQVFLLRHAEAFKNLRDTHGGTGSSLTALGIAQIAEVSVELQSHTIDAIYYIDRQQCKDTALLIGGCLGIKPTVATNISPYHLGIADGISHSEFRQRDPAAASRMDAWRAGTLEIGDLRLPGAEDPIVFYKRGTTFLEWLARNMQNDAVLIATRSVLVLLWNIFLGRTPHKGGGYKEVPWGNCEMQTVDWPPECQNDR
ncbi:hypothetical protein GCM10011609_71390 [Lentzea pudingi]|uniref:Phosphoglycerate mutase n=1 Tax=Lentzea pudingi TaxID=1789439 RepID=A0ABQ2IQJ4_9PSEU|nr:histidine phosphatase family protein [Lentzea pudingi]GGN19961.1 hypothetical protein GCM10011609_71390 [Lentzea pudingi]